MKTTISIKIFLSALCFLIFFACNKKEDETTKMTVEKWKDDIENLLNTLERKHINLYHSVPESQVQKAVDSLIKKLPELSDDEIFINLSKIIRSLDDSHTGIWAQPEFYDAYPFELFVFSDSEIRVMRAPKNHPELLGAKLISIDNTALQEVIRKVLPIIQCADNWYSERERLARYVKYAKILKILDVTKKEDAANFKFLLENGTQKIVKLKAVPQAEYRISLDNSLEFESPFRFDKSLMGIINLWYQPNDELKTAYIYFEKYPNALQMRRFAVAVSRDIIQRGIKNIVIDMRNNGGGNFFVGLELIKLLSTIDQIDWENGVYVVTSRKTYSAGMSNTAHSKELLNAKIVGEPTGANPKDYQDAESFQLQNSGLRVQFSKRYYSFQDTISNGIYPDVHIKPNWESLKQGIDSSLLWILEDISQREN